MVRTESPTRTHRSEVLSRSVQESQFGAGTTPRTQEGAFFFTKKAYCVNQTICVAESRKSVQTQPHPFSPFKALQKLRVPRGFNPLGRSSRAEPSRSCPSKHAGIPCSRATPPGRAGGFDPGGRRRPRIFLPGWLSAGRPGAVPGGPFRESPV